MTPTDFGRALEFTLTDIVRIFKDNPNLCSLRYVLDAVKAANASAGEKPWTCVCGKVNWGWLANCPRCGKFDKQPTADVGAGTAAGPALEEAMAADIQDALDILVRDDPYELTNAQCKQILSHIAAQQAEIERLRDTITDYVNQFRDDSADRARLARELKDHKAVHADQRRLVRELDVLLNGEEGAAAQASLCDIVSQVRYLQGKSSAPMLIELEEAHSLARELEKARRIIRGAHGSSCICAQCETLAAMPREKS